MSKISEIAKAVKKPESELFNAVVWSCRQCLALNYAGENYCAKCHSDWREGRRNIGCKIPLVKSVK